MKKLRVTIPEPCNEDWNKMTPTEQGRYCSVCTKEVTDFTQYSDEALIKYFQKNNNLCGRFKKNQLDRDLLLRRHKASMLQHLSLYSVISFLTIGSLEAQTTKKEQNQIVQNTIDSGKIQKTIKGKVIDYNGDPIPLVTVRIENTNYSTSTDDEGNYEITVDNGKTITFSLNGYKTLTTNIDGRQTVNVILDEKIDDKSIMIDAKGLKRVTYTKRNCSASFNQEEIIIKGNVKDSDNLSLPIVTVIIKGSTNGTTTDFDGNYEIKAKKGDVLMFDFVGYEKQEIQVSNLYKIDVVMKPDETIEGLIVTVAGGVITHNPSEYKFKKDGTRVQRKLTGRIWHKMSRPFKRIFNKY